MAENALFVDQRAGFTLGRQFAREKEWLCLTDRFDIPRQNACTNYQNCPSVGRVLALREHNSHAWLTNVLRTGNVSAHRVVRIFFALSCADRGEADLRL